MKRKIYAVWTGDGANGSGLLSSQSGAFENMPYSFKTRFEIEDGKLGTNPEITQEKFVELALESKMNCPISGVLNCEIQLDASLV